MQTIKTGVVVALLLAVCYGAFVALNAPEPELPEELERWASGDADVESLMGIEMPTGEPMVSMGDSVPISGDALANMSNFDSAPGESSVDVPSLPVLDLGGAGDVATMPAQPPSVPALPSLGVTTPANVDAPNSLAPPTTPPLPSMTATADQVPGFPAVALGGTPELPSLGAATLEAKNKLVSASKDPGVGLPLPEEASAAAAATGSMPDSSGLPTQTFTVAREQALQKAASGQLKEALEQLSPYYDSPELAHAEHADLIDILDALSREVIYSKRHLVARPYIATPTDTLASVAEKHNITQELLASINQLGESKALPPGTELKVVQGPFRATVSLTRGELTLFLDSLYAGRFPISVGKDPTPTEGAFEIVDRRRDRTYYGAGGKVLGAEDPRNPYGGYWLSLGDLCIHGTPEMASSDLEDAGCISLAPLDASDVYHILARGSQVEIRR